MEAVTIATPSGAHMEPAVAAAKAGKHVVVEKPLEVTLKKCDRIIEACDKAGVKLAAIFPSRFHDSSKLMKQAVDAGRFGRLTLGDAYVKWYRTQQYYDSGAWRGTWALDGGGALMNQAVHTVDLLAWLMGPVAEVQANTATLAHERIEVEDTAVATLQFANGALGIIEATTAAYPGVPQADRAARLDRLGGARGGRYQALGLRPEDSQRRECAAANGDEQKHRRRGGATRRQSAITGTRCCFRISSTRFARTGRRRSTGSRVGGQSRSFWRSTSRPKQARK